MSRLAAILIVGFTICAISLESGTAQETKSGEKAVIPGGIEGHVKSIDLDKQTLTMKTSTGSERTFTITDDTTMIGPRGGKVRNGLKDRRFHAGLEVTIVAQGTTAKEVHLGYDRRNAEGSAATTSTSGKRTPSTKQPATKDLDDVAKAPKVAASAAGKLKAAKAAKAKTQEEQEDEDNEIPGKVKSYDADRRHLVVTLLNGQSRSWFLAADLKVVVRGTASKLGLKDPALKVGAPVTVFVESGGRRVKELHVERAPVTKAKSAA